MTRATLPPALVVSLDFELHWGVSERVNHRGDAYFDALHAAREAIPRLLDLFHERGIHASWATVGKLFARGRDDLAMQEPEVRPRYFEPRLDSYAIAIGDSEEADPVHFAPTLVQRIRETPGQEIASHTFAHYYCDEPGQDLVTFAADLVAARRIAARDGIRLRSLVFPRNQVIEEYRDALAEHGFDVYRGNPSGAAYLLPRRGWRRHLGRALRLADSYIDLTGCHTVPWADIAASRPANVCASHFLRPYSRRLRFLEPLRLRRIRSGLEQAAARGEVFHLWWHPHNFGTHMETNLRFLERILDEFERLRRTHGMVSLGMAEAADMAKNHGPGAPTSRPEAGAGEQGGGENEPRGTLQPRASP